jgi:hypothetical protein
MFVTGITGIILERRTDEKGPTYSRNSLSCFVSVDVLGQCYQK